MGQFSGSESGEIVAASTLDTKDKRKSVQESQAETQPPSQPRTPHQSFPSVSGGHQWAPTFTMIRKFLTEI